MRETYDPLPAYSKVYDAGWNAAVEAAAKACEAEALTDDTGTPDDQTYNRAVRDCAAAIRKLKR